MNDGTQSLNYLGGGGACACLAKLKQVGMKLKVKNDPYYG